MLLMGVKIMQFDSFFYKVKKPILCIYSKEMKTYVHKPTCTENFTAA